MDNPEVWHEVSVTWSFLGVDRVVSVLTPDDDHYVWLTAGASAGPLWREVCDSNDVCHIVPNGSAHRFGSRPKGDRLSPSRVFHKTFSRSRPMERVLFGEAVPPGCEGARDPTQSWAITFSPSRRPEMGRHKASLVRWSLRIMQTSFGVK